MAAAYIKAVCTSIPSMCFGWMLLMGTVPYESYEDGVLQEIEVGSKDPESLKNLKGSVLHSLIDLGNVVHTLEPEYSTIWDRRTCEKLWFCSAEVCGAH